MRGKEKLSGQKDEGKSTAKKAVGAPGNADKDKMKECVIKNYGYFYHGDTPVDELDEHSIDAIAVAYSNFLSLSKT